MYCVSFGQLCCWNKAPFLKPFQSKKVNLHPAVSLDTYQKDQHTCMTKNKQQLSCDVRKPDFCICENKDADQLCVDREADQHLCFRYTDSTIPLLPKSEISNLWPSSVAVQPGLCRTWSETTKTGFLTSRLNYPRHGHGALVISNHISQGAGESKEVCFSTSKAWA